MNLIIWLIAGSLVGWIASFLMATDGEQGVLLHVLAGIVGAAIGGWLIAPLPGLASTHGGLLSVGSLAVPVLGAVALLASIHLIQRSTMR